MPQAAAETGQEEPASPLLQSYPIAVEPEHYKQLPAGEYEPAAQLEPAQHHHQQQQRGMGPLAWLRKAAKQLKREVLALYYAMQDPRTGWLPKALAFFVTAYALSPIDLVPDFIPVLGLIDDLLLLPGLIWLAIRMVPAQAMADARHRAETEPLRLSRNWGAACFVLAMWDVLLLGLVATGWQWLGLGGEREALRWLVVGAVGLALVVAEVGWMVWMVRRERAKEAAREAGKGEGGAASGGAPGRPGGALSARPAGPAGGGAEGDEGDLEKGLLEAAEPVGEER